MTGARDLPVCAWRTPFKEVPDSEVEYAHDDVEDGLEYHRERVQSCDLHWVGESEALTSKAAAEAALSKLQADAERYRWLRDRAPWTLISANGVTRLAARLPVEVDADAGDAHEMDAAIDAAIEAAGKTGEAG